MQEKTDVFSSTAGRELITTCQLHVSRKRVYQAWTTPAELAQWWGPDGFTTTVHQMELEPAGLWHLTMYGPDGTSFKNKMVFIEVEPPERLSWSRITAPKFSSTITFEETDGITKVTMRMLFATVEEYNNAARVFGMEAGAVQTMNRLKYFLEGT